jgi:hypothetical protein
VKVQLLPDPLDVFDLLAILVVVGLLSASGLPLSSRPTPIVTSATRGSEAVSDSATL